jgi:hypothetical protein
LVLRRKGKFLRRLRALIAHVSLPNPSRLVFSEDCLLHLNLTVDGIDESFFDNMSRGKEGIVQMFRFCKHIKRVYEIQSIFPDYFDPGLPDWFRNMMMYVLTTNFQDRYQIF